MEDSVRNLKSLKVEPSSYGILPLPLINEKLPTEMRLLIVRNFDKELWDLPEMLCILKHEIKPWSAQCQYVCLLLKDARETKKVILHAL